MNKEPVSIYVYFYICVIPQSVLEPVLLLRNPL